MPPKPWPAGPTAVPTPSAFALGAAALADLIGPLSAADDTLARLDERLRTRPSAPASSPGPMPRRPAPPSGPRASSWRSTTSSCTTPAWTSAPHPTRSSGRSTTSACAGRRQPAIPKFLLTPAGILRLLGRPPRSPESQAGEGAGKDADLWTGTLSRPALPLPRVPLRTRPDPGRRSFGHGPGGPHGGDARRWRGPSKGRRAAEPRRVSV